jgi:hypothetical protein
LNDAFPDVSAALYDTEFRSDAAWRQRLLQVHPKIAALHCYLVCSKFEV